MLETKDIKAPVLFETEKKAAEEFQATVQKLIADRDELTKQISEAQERAKVIVTEIDSLKQELNRTLDKKVRDSLKKSIAKLEEEQINVLETKDLNVRIIMMDKFSDSGVYDLQGQAKEEHAKWFKEIKVYRDQVDATYRETIKELSHIRDHNIYKVTSNQLEDLERFLRR